MKRHKGNHGLNDHRQTVSPGRGRETDQERSRPITYRDTLCVIGWITIAVASYALEILAVPQALSAAFEELFGAWGIHADNVWRAPMWAQMIYRWHGSAVNTVTSVALLGLAALMRRWWPEWTRTSKGSSGRRGVCYAPAGLFAAIAVAALCLIPDSMRLRWPLKTPNVTVELPVLMAISLLRVLAEETFLKGVLYDGIRAYRRRGWATAVVCAVFFLFGGGWSGNIICGINVLLLGALGCVLYESGGLWSAVAYRWGWSTGTVFLMGFGGGNAAVYRLYSLSEAILTGGDSGPMCGLWATLALAVTLMIQGRYTLSSLGMTRTSKGRSS